MQNRQIDKKKTKQVRIDAGIHRLLKIKAAESGMTIKTLLEGYLAEILGVEDELEKSESVTSTIDYFVNKHRKKGNSQQKIEV